MLLSETGPIWGPRVRESATVDHPALWNTPTFTPSFSGLCLQLGAIGEAEATEGISTEFFWCDLQQGGPHASGESTLPCPGSHPSRLSARVDPGFIGMQWIFIILKNNNSLILCWEIIVWFPCGSVGKESTCHVEDLGLIPGLGGSSGEGKGYPLQYSGLENSMENSKMEEGCKELDRTEWLSLSRFQKPVCDFWKQLL